MESRHDQLTDKPRVLCGPILRRITATSVTFHITLQNAQDLRITLQPDGQKPIFLDAEFVKSHTIKIALSPSATSFLINIPIEEPLPQNQWIGYQIEVLADTKNSSNSKNWFSLTELIPDIVFPQRQSPGFVLKTDITTLAHGSCRKPHFPGQDGLARLDSHLMQNDIADWPSVLMLSGDQVYVDDVSGPMLRAIHQTAQSLDMPTECFEGATIDNSDALKNHHASFYHRETLLPSDQTSAQDARHALFSSAKKPIFTSDNAKNHLMSLSEMISMYLLTWSPDCWSKVNLAHPEGLVQSDLDTYKNEVSTIETFQQHLSKVRRVLAHLPTAMIFDDHDVTDDWNLTAEWETSAYEHPFSKRIIGNALIAYLVFQGWGNDPKQFPQDVMSEVAKVTANPGNEQHHQLIDRLLSFSNWHYEWPTQPSMLVMDTRTQRWRSEIKRSNPSGLMDWESLTDLQQRLLDKEAVILVSAAPIFGVKLIETVQKAFTMLGKPLLVDAENWMAHRGAASVLLNMFRHSRTPKYFTILSGDVHYSFVYKIRIRKRKNSPRIWQITSSGIKNGFPERLLLVFDRLNRWLYAPWSPLNWFTKRRRMHISPYHPSQGATGTRLVNAPGIGLVTFDKKSRPLKIEQLTADGNVVEFVEEK